MINVKKQSGFTLVEIAIVLVIIGLLLGGILKGQELVTSARVRNLADQNSGIQAAYYGFVDRYRNLPGDMALVPAQQATGDNALLAGGNANGQIDDGDFVEASAVWAHLRAAGFITGGYNTPLAATAITYIGQNAGIDNAPRNAFLGSVLLANQDEYLDLNVPAIRLAYAFGNQIPVNVMRELDVKVDDGIAQTGVMRASATAAVGAANFGTVNTENGPLGCVDATVNPNIWNVNANEQNCNAVYIY